MTKKTTEELVKIASQVRRDILRMVHAQNSGHSGGLPVGLLGGIRTQNYFHILKCGLQG